MNKATWTTIYDLDARLFTLARVDPDAHYCRLEKDSNLSDPSGYFSVYRSGSFGDGHDRSDVGEVSMIRIKLDSGGVPLSLHKDLNFNLLGTMTLWPAESIHPDFLGEGFTVSFEGPCEFFHGEPKCWIPATLDFM